SATRYMAAELGPKRIRVHAISPGPLKTRAASGISDCDALLIKAESKAPTRSRGSIDDVGVAVAFLATDAAKLITGDTRYIDGCYRINVRVRPPYEGARPCRSATLAVTG